LYNGETPAVQAWLAERAKMNPRESCDALFISERRKPLSRVTVWLLINQVAQAAGLEHLEIRFRQGRRIGDWIEENVP
jgi:site-specific recombinase XerD